MGRILNELINSYYKRAIVNKVQGIVDTLCGYNRNCNEFFRWAKYFGLGNLVGFRLKYEVGSASNFLRKLTLTIAWILPDGIFALAWLMMVTPRWHFKFLKTLTLKMTFFDTVRDPACREETRRSVKTD